MAEEFSHRVNPHTSLTGRGQNDRKAGRIIECLYPMILSRLVLRVRCSVGEQVERAQPLPSRPFAVWAWSLYPYKFRTERREITPMLTLG